MPETFETSIPSDTLSQLSALYAQAPEPTRGKTHEEGRYQAVFDGAEFKQVEGKGQNAGKSFTVFEVSFTVFGPPDRLSDNPLRNVITTDRFLKDEQSMTFLKRDLRSLGIDDSIAFEDIPAALETLKGSRWEIQVSHSPRQDKETGKPSTTDFFQNVRTIRRLAG